MAVTIAHVVEVAILAYATLGALFAAVFVTRGVGRIDHAAAGAPLSFRLLIFPGVAALWPLMLAKWARARKKADA
jgi:hypothetical protein